ncbi:MAG: hypothetical protein FWE23_08860 [Chitinivibrionia bacterium]|nr:hypothetical protein [Chitinivibrionia bacterium]
MRIHQIPQPTEETQAIFDLLSGIAESLQRLQADVQVLLSRDERERTV